jgi:hypothetical protein
MKKSLLNQTGLIALLLLLVLTSNAQWISHGPYGGAAGSIETVGSAVFAGAGHGIYKSTDNGATWALVTPNNKILWTTDITASGGVIYAGTGNNQGIYVSSDGGSTWTQKNTGLTSYNIETIFANEDGAFAQTHKGVFFSADGGNTWAPRNSGLPIQGVLTFSQLGDSLFAGSYGAGLYISTDAGITWTKHMGFPADAYVHGMAIDGQKIYATTETGLYRSDDGGQTWTSTNTVLWNFATIALKDGKLFAGMEDEGIFVSSDMGVTFTKQSNGITAFGTTTIYPRVPDFAVSGNVIIAATYDGIYSSSNDGANWTLNQDGIMITNIADVAAAGDYAYAGAGRMYVSSNKGSSWLRSINGIGHGSIVQVVTHGTSVFASTEGQRIYRSTDNGATWVAKDAGITNVVDLMASDGTQLLALVRGGQNFMEKLMLSKDNGETWIELTGALAISGGITAIAIKGNYIYAGTAQGMLLRSGDEGASWLDIGSYLPTAKITVILPEDEVTYVGTAGKGVFEFTKNDDAMKSLSNGLTYYDISDLVMHDGFLFASTNGAGIFITTKEGNRWFKSVEGLNSMYVTSLAAANGVVYAGTNAGVYQTNQEAFNSFRTLAGIPNPTTAAALQLKIFPNPANENLNYSVDTGYHFEFYSMNGGIIQSYDVTKGEGSIDVSALEAGVYFLKMQSSEETIYRKVIVK